MSDRIARGRLSSMALLGLLCMVTLLSPAGAAESGGSTGRVAGEVRSLTSGRPVTGASVRLPDFGAEATSDENGAFAFAGPLRVAGSIQRIRAVVTAPGFGSWSVSNLPLVAGDTLRLHAELRSTPWSHRVETSSSAPTAKPRLPRTGNTCTGWGSSLVPPPTIKVFLHATGQSKPYDFSFYAAHVLPREWIPSWDADALAAGAVAVKTYAWYRAQPGHAYSAGSTCADVRDDTSDQVFDPTYALDSTSQAVYVSMASVLRKNGSIFLAQYWSGDGANSSQDWKRCEYVNTGTYAGRMSQWGTQVCAQAGKVWPDIAQVFYTGTTWSYLRNMEWNPSFEGGVGTTPWSIGSQATVSVSSNGAAYNGTYALAITPSPAGAYASVRQRVPVVGKTSTKYHAEAAFRCTQGNGSGCTITMRVVSVPDSGSSVGPTYNFTVPQDYRWHLYKIDPAASGIVHSGVSLVFGSHQQFKLDSALVSTAYGGP